MPDTAHLATALADRYRIEREIGAGGMATVYLARDLKHDREVALKVLRPELGAVLGSERFLSEIRISARLDHPHILTLIDSGESGGFLWYVLPFVRGESLRSKLDREKQLSLDEALRIARQIAGALDYAHQHGVVHRDIKPENILLHEGEAMLADFGIALAVKEAGGNRLTETGLSLGTPQYMSPEQATGDRTLDARSDVYSLGAVLYEMLAGEPPVTGPTVQAVIAKLLTERPTHLRVVRDTVPEGIDAAVAKALAKVPADRHASAAAFAAELRAGRRSGGLERRRRPWLVPAGVAVLVLAALGAALAAARRRGAPILPPERVQLTFTGNARTPSLSPDGRRVAYQVRQCGADGRCTVDVVVQDVGGAGAATVVRGLAALWDIEWTSDQRYLVFDGSYGSMRWGGFAVPTLGGAEPRYLGCCAATVIPDGDSVLVGTVSLPGAQVSWQKLVTLTDGRVHDSLAVALPPAARSAVAWVTPDHASMVISIPTPSGLLLRYARRDGSVLDSLFIATTDGIDASMAPEGDALIVLKQRTAPEEHDFLRFALTGSRIADRGDTIARQVTISHGARITPGGLAYAVGPVDHSLWIMRTRAPGELRGEQRELVSSTASVSGSLAPDGSRVLAVRTVVQGSQRRLQLSLLDVASGRETPLGAPFESLEDWDWAAPDVAVISELRGQQAVFSEMNLSTGRLRERFRMRAGDVTGMDASPSSGIVVFEGPGRGLRRQGFSGLRDTVLALETEAGVPHHADFSPDERSVATIGWDAVYDSVIVNRLSLADGAVQRLATFSGEGYDGIRWLPDGTLIFGVQESEGTLAWYRVPVAGGRPVRLGSPPRYPATYRHSPDGRTVLIRARNERPDVYLIRNFREMLER